eukprot:4564070-Prorocentrum_lima.AAC.1
MQLYEQPPFFVELDGNTSTPQTQATGIRQGCPLSPYLFTMIMTAMFHDVHQQVGDIPAAHK